MTHSSTRVSVLVAIAFALGACAPDQNSPIAPVASEPGIRLATAVSYPYLQLTPTTSAVAAC